MVLDEVFLGGGELNAISVIRIFRITASNGSIKVQVALGEETVWASQKGVAEIFGTSRENITMHIGNVFESGELEENAVCKDFLLTGPDGKFFIS